MAPTASILIVRHLERRGGIGVKGRFSWQHVPLVLAGLLTLALTWADVRLADTARTAAADIDARYRQRKDHLWFVGHWGFQYYMEARGFTELDRATRLHRGDLLIVPNNNTNVPPLEPKMFLEAARLEYVACPILTTMHAAVGAGFYASVWGPLPFVFGAIPAERYDVLVLSPH